MTPAPQSNPVSPKAPASEHFLHALNGAAASIAAAGIAYGLGFAHPIYALAAAVIVSDTSTDQIKLLGYHRIMGNALGAVIGAVMVVALGHSVWVVGCSVFLMFFLCYRVGLSDSAKIAAYVSGIVVLEHSADPWHYALDRFLETSIGIVCAFFTTLVLGKVLEHRRKLATQHLPD